MQTGVNQINPIHTLKLFSLPFMPHLPNLPTSVADQRSACICTVSSKGKVQPRTGHESSEGEERYSSTLSLTSALDGGGWSTPRPGRFTPGKDPVPIVHEDP